MTSNSLLSTKLLYSLNSKRHRNKTLLQKGFTLVELMVVIVIVGVLSAVALPNFLSQTDKAKATEAKSNITAILKQVQAEYLETGNLPTAAGSTTTAAELEDYGAPQNDKQKFNYLANDNGANATLVYTVMAKGNSNDGNLQNKKVFGCIALDTGVMETSKVLLDANGTSDVDCGITASKDAALS